MVEEVIHNKRLKKRAPSQKSLGTSQLSCDIKIHVFINTNVQNFLREVHVDLGKSIIYLHISVWHSVSSVKLKCFEL